MFISAVLIVLGGALYRFNVYLIGFNPGQGWIYFPSLAEIFITVGIVALELLGYQVLVKMVPVLPEIPAEGQNGEASASENPASPGEGAVALPGLQTHTQTS